MQHIVLLGPQRLSTTVGLAITDLELEGPLATVTAGWREREDEVAELDDALGVPTVNLRLYHRLEDMVRRDPELLEILRKWHDRAREIQRIYRIQLAGALESARTLLGRPESGPHAEAVRESAIDIIRRVDAEHEDRKSLDHEAVLREFDILQRDIVAAERAAVGEVLDGCTGLVIPGGHVGVLRNRLWLFDVLGRISDRPILAWSAGAMVLSERVVLFHDSPPQGAGNAEVFERGFNLCPKIVPLPHARRRLRLGDEMRVSLFARRFRPSMCVVMDDGGRIDWIDDRYVPHDDVHRLTVDGHVDPLTEPFGGLS